MYCRVCKTVTVFRNEKCVSCHRREAIIEYEKLEQMELIGRIRRLEKIIFENSIGM